MKNYILLGITIVSVFSFNSYAQKNEKTQAEIKVKDKQIVTKTVSKTTSNLVKTYYVEEKINTNFGGYTTTYEVSDPNHIRKTDLGPKNTRVISPRFAVQNKTVEEKIEQENVQPDETHISENHNNYALVYSIKTYERIAEKGYKSIDIFQKLGNYYFFNSDMNKAVRWYNELFAMSTNLESEYYYRYAKSLKSIGENDKANEILMKNKSKN